MKTIASLITALGILGGGGSLAVAQHAHVIQTPSDAAWGPAPRSWACPGPGGG